MITAVIPTHAGRSKFLNRLLTYLIKAKFEQKILIADSSDSKDLQINKNTIAHAQNKLKIKHLAFNSETDILQKLALAMEEIDTPMTAFGADDDFFIPATFSDLYKFIDANPLYSMAMGHTLCFEVENDIERGVIRASAYQKQHSIEYSKASDRLKKNMSDYTMTFYSVHRTSDLKNNLNTACSLNLDSKFSELLLSCLAVIQGRCKLIDKLYLARQSHALQTCRGQEFQKIAYAQDWINSPGWADQYARLQNCLAKELSLKDDIELNDAGKIVKDAVYSYIYKRNIPQSGIENRFTLSSLLDESSPYHKDFVTIYNATKA